MAEVDVIDGGHGREELIDVPGRVFRDAVGSGGEDGGGGGEGDVEGGDGGPVGGIDEEGQVEVVAEVAVVGELFAVLLAGVGAEGDRGPVVDDQVDAPRRGEEGGSGGVEEGLEQGGERNPFVVGESPRFLGESGGDGGGIRDRRAVGSGGGGGPAAPL